MKFNIEGYENMSLEDKVKALEGYEPDMSGFVSKATFDKTASELAGYKKQLREKQTDDEIKAQKEAEERAKLQNDYEALLKKVTISENKAKFLSLGYEDKLATETAEAMANGEIDKVFSSHKAHIEAMEKKIRADVLKETPTPASGSGTGGVDYKKQIEAAQASGDITAMAYYTRLAAQEAANNNK